MLTTRAIIGRRYTAKNRPSDAVLTPRQMGATKLANGLQQAFVDGWEPAAYAAIKALALFATAAAAFRFGGRRTIAEFSPFDWVTAVAPGWSRRLRHRLCWSWRGRPVRGSGGEGQARTV